MLAHNARIRSLYPFLVVFSPQVGLEPTTHRLTADCSTTELLKNTILN